jgi:predicted GNAT family N-acyltransferase
MSAAETVCREVRYGSEEYRETVTLRDEILRKPLKLKFSAEELSAEKDSFHLACWRGNVLTGCVVLIPRTGQTLQMRQLAVRTEMQRKGIGRTLVQYAESFAREHGYHEIMMHARETAVEFYEKLGYKKEGERFTQVTIPHIAMRKSFLAMEKRRSKK